MVLFILKPLVYYKALFWAKLFANRVFVSTAMPMTHSCNANDTQLRVGVAQCLRWWTIDRKVVSLNPTIVKLPLWGP